MDKPVIADNKPRPTDLEKDRKYFFCACGRSNNQPFCDGSHKVTSLTPVGFTADREKGFMCMCKHTKNPPYCDGTHKQFTDEQVGREGPGN